MNKLLEHLPKVLSGWYAGGTGVCLRHSLALYSANTAAALLSRQPSRSAPPPNRKSLLAHALSAAVATTLACLAIPASLSAQDPTPPKPPQQPQPKANAPVAPNTTGVQRPMTLDPAVTHTIDTFFNGLAQKKVDEAYDTLTKGTSIAQRPEDVSTLKTKTQQAIKAFGEITGHELVGAKAVGTHLIETTYLSIGKTLPLRWKFYFYRPDTAWVLVDIRVDDSLVELFDEPRQRAAQ